MARKATAGHAALRQSEHGSHSHNFTHDVVAVDIGGNVLYETEALRASEVPEALDDYDAADADPEVDAFTIRKR